MDEHTNSRRAVARKQTEQFLREETQFHLGNLPTEQSHPYTVGLSSAVQKDAAEGIRMLLSVDQELPPVARRVVLSEEYDLLVKAFLRVAGEGKRVCFSGCGATGRLSIMLEEMWRGFWEDRADLTPGDAEIIEKTRDLEESAAHASKMARMACSIMTGGDRALISSVEGFEDYETFGARQVADLGLGNGDLLVAISEGGETSSVIGTAFEALRKGCEVFFVYNNPSELLVRDIERSRRLITDDRVVTIDLYTGQMALAGSTRMQATTLEMFVVGAAMEEALEGSTQSAKTEVGPKTDANKLEFRLETVDRFADLIASFQKPENREILGDIANAEAKTYSEKGRITYFAERYLLDIFCDTTERTPTFMLPPFRPADDTTSAVSWAYAKHPGTSSDSTWYRMLRRKPRGLEWNADDYRDLGATDSIVDDPPKLNNHEIQRYVIGCEDDVSRYETDRFLCISVQVEDGMPLEYTGSAAIPGDAEAHHRRITLAKETEQATSTSRNEWRIGLAFEKSQIYLWHHLAVKLLFNTISTASMGIMGRIQSNWMVQVDCTNKKLVDRGSRIVSELSGASYDQACFELHVSLLKDREARESGALHTTISPVISALERLKT